MIYITDNEGNRVDMVARSLCIQQTKQGLNILEFKTKCEKQGRAEWLSWQFNNVNDKYHIHVDVRKEVKKMNSEFVELIDDLKRHEAIDGCGYNELIEFSHKISDLKWFKKDGDSK